LDGRGRWTDRIERGYWRGGGQKTSGESRLCRGNAGQLKDFFNFAQAKKQGAEKGKNEQRVRIFRSCHALNINEMGNGVLRPPNLQGNKERQRSNSQSGGKVTGALGGEMSKGEIAPLRRDRTTHQGQKRPPPLQENEKNVEMGRRRAWEEGE